MFEYSFVLIVLLAVFLLVGAVAALLAKFYRKCPEGKLMVVWGPRPPGTFVIVDSGGRFVLPLLYDYAYLSRAPLNVLLPDQGNRQITVKIGDDPELRRKAAVYLLGLSEQEIIVRVQEVLGPGHLGQNDLAPRDELASLGLEIV
jgi:hypothetical protein